MQKLVLAMLLCASGANAQKKVIDYTVYDKWKDLKSNIISDNGVFTAFTIEPQVGDGWLYVVNNDTKERDSVFRAENATFGPESDYLIYKVVPGYDTVRTLKLAKTKPNKMPKDTGAVRLFRKDTTILFPDMSSYSIPKEGSWIVIKLGSSSYSYEPPKPKRRFLFFKPKNQKTIEKSTEGKDIIILNAQSLKTDTITNVIEYDLSENGNILSLIRHWKIDTVDSFVVERHDLNALSSKQVHHGTISASKITTSFNGSFIAFFGATDTSKNKIQNLYFWQSGNDSATIIVDSSNAVMPNGWCPSEHMSPYFSEDESKLYFGIAPFPYNEPKDTLLDSEKHSVDVWNWKDKKIQPQQLLRRKYDMNKTYMTVWHTDEKRAVRLENEEIEGVYAAKDKNHDLVIGTATGAYEKSYSWSMPWPSDYYLIDENTGTKKLLKKAVGTFMSLSPSGKNILYFDENDSTWHNIETAELEDKIISNQIRGELALDNNGSPYMPGPYGFAGWNVDESGVMLYTENDIWLVDVRNPDRVKCLTCGLDSNLVFRHIGWDKEEDYIDLNKDVDFIIYNELTKDMGIARMDNTGNIFTMLKGPFALAGAKRAKDTNRYLIRLMSFQMYPDVYLFEDEFNNQTRLSYTNTQQSEYNWGTVELVKWKSFKGIELEGLLYKPENFDPKKKYPMITYFYEKYDSDFHNHYVPKPTASIVYPTEYVSNGYIVFIPNIEYQPGHPGKSAYDCIVSGTDYLTEKYDWIDSEKIGLQGQSWGGYQTAYLVTQTDKYAAAMAGAPVSNMTSAYGGIRWGSGMSRMFQYERTQSRIGYTLWDSLELYIENSPIFFVPNINTPILIMHNDGDGAVPWYQGIEYFMALRRLNKPAWMLNYNDDEHNLMRRANRLDLSIRMRQFFDHYLLGASEPVWMRDGIPATDKGRVTGYELID